MKNKFLDTFLADANFTLTPLRRDVLNIMSAAKEPMGAYDILKKLRIKRANAELPTVQTYEG